MKWFHPIVGLGQFVQQVGAFLDMLILASGFQSDGIPAKWNSRSLHNALGWAFYLEQVLNTLPLGDDGNESRLALDSALVELLENVPLPPGITTISSTVLANSRSLLVRMIVQAVPAQNAWLLADVVDSDEIEFEDLWEIVISEMSVRCLAFGCVKSLQEAANVAAWSSTAICEDETTKVDIWNDSSGPVGSEVCVLEEWANKGIMYITSAETLHKLSGATLIFSSSQPQWAEVLDSLQNRFQTEGRTGIKTQVAELCCLFLASPRWKEIPRMLLHPHCKSSKKSKEGMPNRFQDCWKGKEAPQLTVPEGVMSRNTKEEVEGYLQKLLEEEKNLWWDLAPILLAAALAECSLLESYVKTIGERTAEVSSSNCCVDWSCQLCQHSKDAQERAWCLSLLDHQIGSGFGWHLHNMPQVSNNA